MSEFRLPLNEELGQFLKQTRKDSRISIEQLSKLSGVSMAEISRIENSLRVPNFLIVGKLERALAKARDETILSG